MNQGIRLLMLPLLLVPACSSDIEPQAAQSDVLKCGDALACIRDCNGDEVCTDDCESSSDPTSWSIAGEWLTCFATLCGTQCASGTAACDQCGADVSAPSAPCGEKKDACDANG